MGWVLCVLGFSKALAFSNPLDTDSAFLYLVGLWKEIKSLQGSWLELENHCPKGSDCFSTSLPPGSENTLGEQSVSSIH